MIISTALLYNLVSNFFAYFIIGLLIGYIYIFFYASLAGAIMRRFLRQIFLIKANQRAIFIRLYNTKKSGFDQ